MVIGCMRSVAVHFILLSMGWSCFFLPYFPIYLRFWNNGFIIYGYCWLFAIFIRIAYRLLHCS